MWRETKILLIDDSVRRRDLVILKASVKKSFPAATTIGSRRSAHVVQVGTVTLPGAVLGLLKVSAWDEFLPGVADGRYSSVDLPEDQRRRVLSTKCRPATANCSIPCTAPRSIARWRPGPRAR